MKHVLVSGGVGYVGRELIRQLGSDAALDIDVIDTLSSGRRRLDSMDRSRFTLHEVDIRDGEAVGKILMDVKPDVIIHLAAIHFIPLCERKPGFATSVNVAGTANLLAAAPEGARFVCASSAAVYAPFDDAHVEGESAVGPMDVYGWNKLHAEHYVDHFHRAGRIEGVNVRLFNVVGSGETNPHLAPAIIEQLEDGVETVQLGNLFPRRDYINVADAAEGFRRLAQVPLTGSSSLTCNLGSGVAHEVGEMVRSIADASGRTLKIEQDEARVRAVDRPVLVSSVEKLYQLTGWKPQIKLEQSMREAWQTRMEDRLD